MLPKTIHRKADKSACQWTEADKAANPSVDDLPHQPLATRGGLSADEHHIECSFGGIEKYNGPRGPRQLLGKIDFTPVHLVGKG